MANRLAPRKNPRKPITGGIYKGNNIALSESPHEDNALLGLALCQDVTEIHTQIELPGLVSDNNHSRSFYPDILIITSDAKKLIIEIKTTKTLPKIDPQLLLTRYRAAREQNYDAYILFLDHQINVSPILTIAKTVTPKRRHCPSTQICSQITEFLSFEETASAVNISSKLNLSLNDIYGAIFHGVLACDLRHPNAEELTVSLPNKPYSEISYEKFINQAWSCNFFRQLDMDRQIPVELLPNPPQRSCNT